MDTILCEKPDHAEMPKHYHLAGEFEARLQRLEEFKTKVEQLLAEPGDADGVSSDELQAGLAAVDA